MTIHGISELYLRQSAQSSEDKTKLTGYFDYKL